MAEAAPGALLRVLVVDDERLGRKRALDLLARVPDTVVVVEAVASGQAAVETIREGATDVVFLDVQMPDRSGLDVVEEVGPAAMPVTVFVTAYDRHALKAFELAALDYLLKPYEDERFFAALDRARAQVQLRRGGEASAGAAAPSYLERIAVELRGQRRFVPVARVDYVTADGPYAELHAGGKTFVIRERMQTLEAQLDPARFFRIHRSAIVQLDRVEALLIGTGGDYAVRLRDGTPLRVARSRRDALADRLARAPRRGDAPHRA